EHLHSTNQLTVTLCGSHTDNALRTAAFGRELTHLCTFAVTMFAHGQHLTALHGNDHADYALAVGQTNTAHTARGAAHGAHFHFTEARCFPAGRKQNDVALTVGNG